MPKIQNRTLQKLGISLIIFSFLPWIAILFIVPVLPLTLAQKALLVPLLILLAEVPFWLGLLLVGKEMAQRYRQYFSIRRLWRWLQRKLFRN